MRASNIFKPNQMVLAGTIHQMKKYFSLFPKKIRLKHVSDPLKTQFKKNQYIFKVDN